MNKRYGDTSEDLPLSEGSGKKPKFDFKNLDRQAVVRVGAIVGVTMLVIGSIYQFVVLPSSNARVRQQTIAEVDVNAMPKVSVAVLKPEAKIAKYTMFTDEIVQKDIQVMQVPLDFAINNPMADPSLLVGKVTTVDLIGNSQISMDQLTDQTDWFGKFDRLKEYSITNTVGGQAQVGNIVDVIVDYGNGNYDVVVAKKKIVNIKPLGATAPVNTTNANGQPQQALGDNNQMVFSVDEAEFANLELAKTMGELKIRLYVDEGQEPSDVTFKASNAASIKAQLESQKNGATNAGKGQ